MSEDFDLVVQQVQALISETTNVAELQACTKELLIIIQEAKDTIEQQNETIASSRVLFEQYAQKVDELFFEATWFQEEVDARLILGLS